MALAGIKAKRLSSVNHTAKTIHHHFNTMSSHPFCEKFDLKFQEDKVAVGTEQHDVKIYDIEEVSSFLQMKSLKWLTQYHGQFLQRKYLFSAFSLQYWKLFIFYFFNSDVGNADTCHTFCVCLLHQFYLQVLFYGLFYDLTLPGVVRALIIWDNTHF